MLFTLSRSARDIRSNIFAPEINQDPESHSARSQSEGRMHSVHRWMMLGAEGSQE